MKPCLKRKDLLPKITQENSDFNARKQIYKFCKLKSKNSLKKNMIPENFDFEKCSDQFESVFRLTKCSSVITTRKIFLTFTFGDVKISFTSLAGFMKLELGSRYIRFR